MHRAEPSLLFPLSAALGEVMMETLGRDSESVTDVDKIGR